MTQQPLQVGSRDYAHENTMLQRLIDTNFPLIAAHRGVHRGIIVENTVEAALLAVASSADTVECDVVRSQDGKYYIFHDGYEHLWFGFPQGRTLEHCQSDQIDSLTYRLAEPNHKPRRIDTAQYYFRQLFDVLITVDRSDRYWNEGFLEFLAGERPVNSVILKCSPESHNIALLADCEAKFPVMPIVTTMEQVEQWSIADDINLVGFEVLCDDPQHPFANKDFHVAMRQKDLLTLVNCETLETGRELFLGWDDYQSVVFGSDKGWDRCIAVGASLIHTDYPWLVAQRRQVLSPSSGDSKQG